MYGTAHEISDHGVLKLKITQAAAEPELGARVGADSPLAS
jgi:hypothetical protein